MKELLFFKILSCPYCKAAEGWIEELTAENPAYAAINIRRVDEQAEADFANSFDYFKVPTFYLSGEKLHEGAASKEIIKAVLDKAL